jgi:hypothetical protein
MNNLIGCYCMQQGILKILTESEQQEIYAKNCLLQAEKALDNAKFELQVAETLIQESHRYDANKI